MLTGVSLIGDATCVLLRLCDDGFAPITLPLTGYNRLGAIDGVAENPNSQLIVDFFAGICEPGGSSRWMRPP
jgi:hypothetical protein